MKRIIIALAAMLAPLSALAAPTQINLNTQVQGVLPVAKGGTGGTTSTGSGAVVLGTSPSTTSETLTTPTISGGTINSATIGATTAASVNGTTITASTAFAGPHNGTVGATTPNTGSFTTLAASSTVSGTGFSTYLASPPAIGGTAAAAGSFTTLGASSLMTTAASTTSSAGIRLPHGAAPTSPTNGDLWTTTTGLFARINGATVGPYGSGGGSPGGSTTQIQYNNAGAFAGASGITTTGTELTIAPAANATPLTISGYSVTGSGTTAMVSTGGTLNTTGIVDVDFQNITNTASNSSSTIIRRQVGGVDKFKVGIDGKLTLTNTLNIPGEGFIDSPGGNEWFLGVNGSPAFGVNKFGSSSGGGVWVANAGALIFSNGQYPSAGDPQINRYAANTLGIGTKDAAAPVGQTILHQSVVGGTTNTPGVNWVLGGSKGTGTGAGGNIDLQTATAGTTGSSQNALATTLSVRSDGTVIEGRGFTVSGLPTAGTAGRRAWVTDATACTFASTPAGGGSTKCPVFDNGTGWIEG